MKSFSQSRLVIVALVCTTLCLAANAGTFKRIAIDGSFGDWAGVPVAYTDASETTAGADFRLVYVANDDEYLYIRFTLYASNSPFTSPR